MRRILIFTLIFISSAMSTANAFEYIGHAEAARSVEIRPEISARITKIHFNEGTFVNKSLTLFTLNNAQFQAEVSLKKAELSHARAVLEGASKYLSRLKAADQRGVTASDMDTAQSEVKKARAMVEEAKAALQISQIQLNNTKITAPFSGLIGKINYHNGSYVSPENVLCEIVQVNPIRILFAMPDRDYLKIKNSGKKLKYELILADDSLYSETVEKDFEDNVMNPETGTINIRLKVSNENNILLPGSLVRVRITEE